MNIYIYGNQSFKKEIHKTLDHSNIKFKIEGDIFIKEIDTSSELKDIIKNNPRDIYLIDDEKIIKKGSLKLFKPKDGIEQEFLSDSGISDLSVDSLKEIPKYILKKHEENKFMDAQIEDRIRNEMKNEFGKSQNIKVDEELPTLLSNEDEKIVNLDEDSSEDNLEDLFDSKITKDFSEIEDLLKDIDEGEKNSINDFNEVINFNDNFGLNNISFDYDDENLVNNNKLEGEDLFSNFDKEDSIVEELTDIKFDSDDFFKEEKNENIIDEIMPLKGDRMLEDEFSELDSLSEKDLLEALNYSEKNLNDMLKEEKKAVSQDIVKNNTTVEIVESANINELASLLSKLLNNKTLEITIKIRD